MDIPRANSTSLFDVYLRLRPSYNPTSERFLGLDDPSDGHHTHITVKPPSNDHRKRAIEKFGFTRVFEETASQRDVFDDINLAPSIEGVIAPEGKVGKDALVATLGMTGSGKVKEWTSHGIRNP